MVRQAYAVGIVSLLLAAWWICPWCLHGYGEATERSEAYARELARSRAHDDVASQCTAKAGTLGTIYTDSDSCAPDGRLTKCVVTVFGDCSVPKK